MVASLSTNTGLSMCFRINGDQRHLVPVQVRAHGNDAAGVVVDAGNAHADALDVIQRFAAFLHRLAREGRHVPDDRFRAALHARGTGDLAQDPAVSSTTPALIAVPPRSTPM